MRPVTQTDNRPGTGDCLGACVASILECDLAPLPVPVDNSPFEWMRFLEGVGILLLGPGRHKKVWWDSYWIGIVPSVNNVGRFHAVVMNGRDLAWDPNIENKLAEVSIEDVVNAYLLVLSDMSLLRKSGLCAL